MSVISLLNIGYFVTQYRKPNTASATQIAYVRQMRLLAGFYVFGCAFRTIFPRIDVERICFFDTVLCCTFLGRCAATVAEILYVKQISLALTQVASDIYSKKNPQLYQGIRFTCNLCVVAICIAQCWCWRGIITKNNFSHCVEQSIWVGTFVVFFTCAIIMYGPSQQQNVTYTAQTTKQFLLGLILLVPLFALYMVLVDIPMYYYRYQQDQLQHGGRGYLNLEQGITSSLSCQQVSRDYNVWKEDMVWMTGYFVFAVWSSLWLMRAPRIKQ
jgi:hypothetical protein